jgi:choline dehydrogenase
MAGTYDFIIVGGGSAGSALANRLSAQARVLVLEAGRPDYRWDVFIHMPAALTFPIGSRFYDWQYESEPEPHLNGRRIYHARGKVLGGSSSINGMIFQRGNPLDYERWAADDGMASWDYAHCLPYFKQMESCLAGGDEFRGTSGPLVLERGPATSPLFGAFFEAVQQAGYRLTPDVNGYRQEGFAPFDRNVHRGRRLSAARAYLHPVLNRDTLTVRTRASVGRILFDGQRATGVEYRHRGRSEIARAGEVILRGGAINSPQVLQLCGVGPAAHLRALGIEVVADRPGVGANLQDHLEVYVQHASTQPVSVAPALQWRNRPMVGARWLLARSGRFGRVLAGDWGWWRTVTGNLAKLPGIVASQPELIPPRLRFDPVAQAKTLADVAESVPKSVKWRVRANLGDRVRWYERPEEVAH